MSTYAYPYDPTAAAAGNVVIGENHSLNDYKNKWLCVIPKYAPFYRKDLEIRLDGKLLYEGMDYYLGHYYGQASEETKFPIFGSIMLLDTDASGTLTFSKYRTLGGVTNVTSNRIETYLGTEPLPDPRNEDWAKVMQRTIVVPGVSPPSNITEAIERDEPTAALDRVRAKLDALNEVEKEKFNAIFERISALADKTEAFDIGEHEHRNSHHAVTYQQLSAIKKDGTAIDALKAYGRTLAELTTIINNLGINQEDLDSMFLRAGGVLEGRMTLEGNSVVIENTNGRSSINMTSGNITIIAQSGVELAADFDNNSPSVAAYLKAAQNQLTVHSDGSGRQVKSVVFNGFYLVHAGNIGDFLPPPGIEDTVLHVESSDTVSLSGLGTGTSPLTGTVYFPKATTTNEGLFILTHSIFSTSQSHAASGRGLQELYNTLERYVPKTRRINNIQMSGGSIALNKTHVNLGNVENTAPGDKVVSNAFKVEVEKLSDVGHRHENADFDDIPLATNVTHGLAQLSTNLSDSKTTAIVPAALNATNELLQTVSSEITRKLPSRVIDVMQYGGFGYLPKPVLGSYGAAGAGGYGGAGEVEANGDFVLLRNGGDSFGWGVYYYIVEYNANGTPADAKPTTVEYKPAWLPPGRRVRRVEQGFNGCFTAILDNDVRYLVLTRGTMDGSRHVAAKFDTNFVPHMERRPIIVGTMVYIVEHTLSNSAYYVSMWSTPISNIEKGDAGIAVWERLKLSGQGIYDTHTDVETFRFANTGISRDKANKPVAWLNDNNFWSGSKNLRHSACNSDLVSDGNKIRVTTSLGSYFSNGYTSGGNAYTTGFDVDVVTRQVTLLSPESYPFEVTENTWQFGQLGRSAGRWPGGAPNSNSAIFRSKNKMISWRMDGLVHTPLLYATEIASPSGNMFNDMNPITRSFNTLKSYHFLGSTGSIVKGPFNSPKLRDGNRIVYTCANGLVVERYDPDSTYADGVRGWGPTTDRKQYTAGWGAWRIPYLADTDKCEGATWSHGEGTQPTRQVGETLSATVTFPELLSTPLLAELLSRDQAINGGRLIEQRLNVHAFGEVTGTINVIIVHGQYFYSNDSRNTKSYVETISTGTVTVSGANVTAYSLGAKIHQQTVSGSVTGLGSRSQDISCNYRGRLDDGRMVYIINQSQYVGYVGHGGAMRYIVTLKDGVYTATGAMQHTHTVYGGAFAKDLGMMYFGTDANGQSVTANVHGKAANAHTAPSLYSATLSATKVATGTTIYFTQRERFYCERRELWLEPQTIDLANHAPYGNRTFYIYVESNLPDGDGIVTASYVLKRNKEPDTSTSLYIGHVKTDATTITELKVESATRLGSIFEVDEHINNPKAHPHINSMSKESFGLAKVRNMSMVHNIELPTFETVFNTWKRFVHWSSTTTQPADVGAMNSWSYNSALGSMQTALDNITKHMLVGFVSPTPIGDYIFDTEMYVQTGQAGNPEGDDDWMGLVLAYATDSAGREHTLCAMRSGGAEAQELYLRVNGDGAHYQTGIVKNYHQGDGRVLHADNIRGADYTAHSSLGRTRIRAIRSGDSIHVQFYGWSGQGNGSEVISEYTVDLMEPDLNIFRGQARFGYMAQSQGLATFESNARPDENVGNYYASADMCRLLGTQIADNTAILHGVAAAGSAFPIPPGFSTEDCQVILRPYGFHGNPSTKVASWRLSHNQSTRVVDMRLVYSGGTSYSTNPAGATYVYYVFAKKRV